MFKSDRISSVIAGVCSGLFLSFEKSNRRYNVTLIVLSRAIFTAMTKADNDGYKCKFNKGEVLSVCTLMTFVIYVAAYHREVLSKASNKMIFSATLQKPNDCIYRYLWRNKQDYKDLVKFGMAHTFDFKAAYDEILEAVSEI